MLIRSQDKTALVVLETCDAINFMRGEELYLIYANGCSQASYHLGNYSTRDKVIKVLDEIQEAYLKANCQPLLSEYGFVKNTIFKMPFDEEVKV